MIPVSSCVKKEWFLCLTRNDSFCKKEWFLFCKRMIPCKLVTPAKKNVFLIFFTFGEAKKRIFLIFLAFGEAKKLIFSYDFLQISVRGSYFYFQFSEFCLGSYFFENFPEFLERVLIFIFKSPNFKISSYWGGGFLFLIGLYNQIFPSAGRKLNCRTFYNYLNSNKCSTIAQVLRLLKFGFQNVLRLPKFYDSWNWVSKMFYDSPYLFYDCGQFRLRRSTWQFWMFYMKFYDT